MSKKIKVISNEGVCRLQSAFETGLFRAYEAHSDAPVYVQLRRGYRNKPLTPVGLTAVVQDALEGMANIPGGILGSCAF